MTVIGRNLEIKLEINSISMMAAISNLMDFNLTNDLTKN